MTEEIHQALLLLKRAADMAPDDEFLGDRIRRLRTARGLSLDDLANRTKITRGYLWKLETGRSMNPGLLQLRKLARSLRVKAGYLADSKGAP